MKWLLRLWAVGFVWVLGGAIELPCGRAEAPAASDVPSQAMQVVYGEALQLMNQGKIDEALAKLASGPQADAGHSAVLNLKGALLVRKKDYAGAAAAFGKIIEQSPNHAVARFNMGEVHFLQKNYSKAKEFFGQFLNEPGNSQNALARYKVFLCDLLGADPAAAGQTLKGLQPTITHPLYYYAHAAAAFKAGEEAAAREYIESAFGIYPPGLNAAFADSMIELGWLKQEEVGRIGAIDSAALQTLSSEFSPESTSSGQAKISDGLGFENMLPDFAREKEPAAAPAPKP